MLTRLISCYQHSSTFNLFFSEYIFIFYRSSIFPNSTNTVFLCVDGGIWIKKHRNKWHIENENDYRILVRFEMLISMLNYPYSFAITVYVCFGYFNILWRIMHMLILGPGSEAYLLNSNLVTTIVGVAKMRIRRSSAFSEMVKSPK